MELILLTQKNKTPFVGIRLADDFEADNIKVSLIQNTFYDLEIIIYPNKALLRVMTGSQILAIYENLKFESPMQFDNFIEAPRPNGKIKFGYLIWEVKQQMYRQ